MPSQSRPWDRLNLPEAWHIADVAHPRLHRRSLMSRIRAFIADR
jgi:hypothetical protein